MLRIKPIGLGVLLALTLAPATSAHAKIRVSVLGWTTQGGATSPQVEDKATIDNCLDDGAGQRSLRVIFRGKGITKGTKVGVAVWGGPARTGFMEEPSNATLVKNAFRWPVGPSKSSTQPYGFSFANGPFGPQDINGEWRAKIVIRGKVVARGRVTIAC